MFRKELLTLSFLAAVIFLLVAGVTAWMAHALANNARMIVVDTLPGLVNAGEALNVMDNNWEKILGLTSLPTAETRLNVIQQIHAHSTQEFWASYEQSIFDPHDRQLFAAVQAARSRSRVLADQFFALVRDQHLDAAQQLLEKEMTPVFAEYRAATLKLFELNKTIGDRRSEHILSICRWLPLSAAVSSVLVFGLGFAFGLRGAFTGLEMMFQRGAGMNQKR